MKPLIVITECTCASHDVYNKKTAAEAAADQIKPNLTGGAFNSCRDFPELKTFHTVEKRLLPSSMGTQSKPHTMA